MDEDQRFNVRVEVKLTADQIPDAIEILTTAFPEARILPNEDSVTVLRLRVTTPSREDAMRVGTQKVSAALWPTMHEVELHCLGAARVQP